jgi:hypothetical protein
MPSMLGTNRRHAIALPQGILRVNNLRNDCSIDVLQLLHLIGSPFSQVHDFLHAVVPEGQSQRAIAVKLIVDARRAAASAAGSSTR